MSRRTHTTEVGSILCTDLDEIGAGKEHWLVTDPQILCALDTHSIALAKRSVILILNWAAGYDRPALKIRPNLSPIGAECLTAIEWLRFDEYKVVLVGTSKGYLLIFSVEGDLIHKQLVYSGRVLKVRVRGFKKDSTRDTLSVEVSVVLSGVIARFDGSDIKSMLDRWFQESHSQFWDRKGELEDLGNSYGRLPYQLWNVSKFGTCTVDAAITGIMPPPLLEVQSSQCYYCAISVGEDAVISAYRLSEDRNRSLVGAILSKVVPAAYSTISSFSKLLWRSEEPSTKRPEEKPQPFARAAPLTCLKDHPRKGEKLTLSPSGSLAAITDSLGRVLLLDTQAMVVVRLWKGYRDACCLFMEMMVKKNAAASEFDDHEAVKSDYCLCLAIHAPRKGIIEVWQMRTGPRLLSIQCPKGSKMLQPAYRSGSMDFPYVPLEVFLLNGDSGQLSVLNRSLN